VLCNLRKQQLSTHDALTPPSRELQCHEMLLRAALRHTAQRTYFPRRYFTSDDLNVSHSRFIAESSPRAKWEDKLGKSANPTKVEDEYAGISDVRGTVVALCRSYGAHNQENCFQRRRTSSNSFYHLAVDRANPVLRKRMANLQ